MKKMATEIFTEIEIQGTPAQVWAVLMDFAAYPDWNPFVRRIEGNAEPGSRLQVVLSPPGGSAMTFKPKVLAANASQEFRWLGHLLFPGIFDGEHRFELHDLGNGRTRFVQAERFRGILVPFLRKMLNTKTQDGFHQMNAALKARVEARKS